jgi:hypothetical protein
MKEEKSQTVIVNRRTPQQAENEKTEEMNKNLNEVRKKMTTHKSQSIGGKIEAEIKFWKSKKREVICLSIGEVMSRMFIVFLGSYTVPGDILLVWANPCMLVPPRPHGRSDVLR